MWLFSCIKGMIGVLWRARWYYSRNGGYVLVVQTLSFLEKITGLDRLLPNALSKMAVYRYIKL